jgi:DNA (cytosine-5)-methyltransferase 1
MWNADINWHIRQLPPLPVTKTKLPEILENLSPNSQIWWSRERAEYLLNQMSPKHRAKAEAMIQGSRVTFGTVFRRVRKERSMAELRTDDIAGCLRTPRGGSGRQILFAAGRGRFMVRLLTPRECARLMGADDFVIRTTLNQALFGFGDAVCVPVVEWIGENYLNRVWEEDYAKAEAPKNTEPITSYRKALRR